MAICHNKQYENEFVRLMLSKGYHCERVAGSGSGREAVCDCVLFKDGKVYLVEVKATKEKKFYMRKGIREQLQRMKEVAEKSNVEWMLAVKLKRQGWTYYKNSQIEL
ncbi:MAG: hypothetical protein U9O94_02120 [Nanoarchaeota archaeon]|nr:hypothetical protein [Nanoarchaeota archaeon]